MEKNNYITVSQLNRYLKYKIDNDTNLSLVFLKGEISNFKNHTRGHLYFTIKDETSRINAIMFASLASKVPFKLYDGMKVLVTGRVGVYEASGSYQIYVEELQEDGLGSLFLAFEQLKEKLEKEGLFLESHKKKIPKIPNKIGIITAPTGAAIKDILSTIKRRWPLCETILFPALVQGEFAKDDIVKKIKIANTYDLDVLIVGRGGGSIEDLWPFNEEVVARAIYNSNIPIISAVGHEIDFTIADFVADKRAPTPTGAAEMAVPNILDVSSYLNQVRIRLHETMNNKLSLSFKNLEQLKNRTILKNPYRIYEIKEQNFDNLYEKMLKVFSNYLDIKKQKLDILKQSFVLKNPLILFKEKEYKLNNLKKQVVTSIKKYQLEKESKYVALIGKFEVLNPITTLKRGYSIARNEKVISTIKNIQLKDKITIELMDGYIESEVLNIYDKN